MTILLLCLKVFFVRIIDVSLGTFRTVMTVKGKVSYASIIGFFEVLIWFLIVKEALNTSENSILVGISYALGFATGTFIGGKISFRLINGIITIEVITSNLTLSDFLRNNGYAVTEIEVKGKDSKDKRMLFLQIHTKEKNKLKSLVHQIDEKAFIVIQESQQVTNGYFASNKQ